MLDEVTLFELAKNLLGQIIEEGKVWPCANLSLSISGFEDGITGNRDIGSFLVKGEEAKALNFTPRDSSLTVSERHPEKRRRLGNPGIQRFFVKTESTDEHEEDFMGTQPPRTGATTAKGGDADLDGLRQEAAMNLRSHNEATSHSETGNVTVGSPVLHQQQISGYLCNRCGRSHESADALQNHKDWHFAKDLQDEDKQRPAPQTSTVPVVGNKIVALGSSRKKVGGRSKPEKGQSKLAFG